MGSTYFFISFEKIVICHKRIGYNLNVMRQSACLVVNTITGDNFAAPFNCTPMDRASDSMMTKNNSFYLVGTGALSSVAWSIGAQLTIFVCFRFPVVLFGSPGISNCHATRCTC